MAVGFAATVAALSLMLPLLGTGASGASTHAVKASPITSLPRNETLYTSGAAYSAPTIWNPMDLGNFATGTEGLVYETLFLYNPVAELVRPVAGQERYLDDSEHVHDRVAQRASPGATGNR